MHYNLQVKYIIQHICTRNRIYHILSPWVVDFVVMRSFLRVWEVEVLRSNPAMGSAWEITLYFRLILTSVLDKGWVHSFNLSRSPTLTGPGLAGRLSLWSHPSGRCQLRSPPSTHFSFIKKRIHHIFIQYNTKQGESNIAKYNSYKPIFNSNLLLNKLKTLDGCFKCFFFFLIF